jgi:hypothetical protein
MKHTRQVQYITQWKDQILENLFKYVWDLKGVEKGLMTLNERAQYKASSQNVARGKLWCNCLEDSSETVCKILQNDNVSGQKSAGIERAS